MLGQQHLHLLRTLKQADRPVKDGLHRTAPFGMVSQGFVNSTDEGYVLSSKGNSVLYLYDEVSGDERELLMRVHSHHVQEMSFPARDEVMHNAEKLIEKGLLYADNNSLFLSEIALKMWDGWVEFWDMKRKRHEANRRERLAVQKQSANGAAPTKEAAVIAQPEAAPPPRSQRAYKSRRPLRLPIVSTIVRAALTVKC